MKRIFFPIAFLLMSIPAICQNFDGYVDLTSYQRIYYKFDSTNQSISICPPNNTNWNTYAKPSGNLIIPDSITHNGTAYPVTVIGNNAFVTCNELTSIVIPDAVTSIGSHAFSNCSGLPSVNIPNGIDSIGEGTFFCCSSLAQITIPEAVTFIGKYAFSYCHCLSSITIPSAVTYIGNEAFHYCSGLTSVSFNADSCTFAGDFSNSNEPAFYNLGGITTFTFGENVKVIPNYLCYGLAGLSSVTIGSNVTSIGAYSFWNCFGLTTISIPERVTSIGNWAFKGCSGLTSVVFNADSCVFAGEISPISLPAFYNLGNINSITIGENVKVIPSYLCCGLNGLTSLSVPSNVSVIGDYALKGCTNITDIYMSGENPPTTFDSTFANIPASTILHVACDAAPAYQNANDWDLFNIVEEFPYNFSATSNNQTHGTVQILHNPECINNQAEVQANPSSGFHFVRWDDGDTNSHRYIEVVQDTTIQAEFAEDSTEGIENINDNSIRIYSFGSRIMVEGTTDEVRVYDMTGRSVRNEALPAGVYMVKIGEQPARKVVVMQ